MEWEPHSSVAGRRMDFQRFQPRVTERLIAGDHVPVAPVTPGAGMAAPQDRDAGSAVGGSSSSSSSSRASRDGEASKRSQHKRSAKGDDGESVVMNVDEYMIMIAEVERLRKAKVDVEMTLSFRDAEVASMRTKILEMEEELTSARSRIATAEALVQTVAEQRELTKSYKQELDAARGELRRLASAMMHGQGSSRKPAKAEVPTPSKQAQESTPSQSASLQISKLHEDMKRQRDSNFALRERVRKLQREVSSRDEELTSMTERLSSLQNRNASQRNHIGHLKDKLSRLTASAATAPTTGQTPSNRKRPGKSNTSTKRTPAARNRGKRGVESSGKGMGKMKGSTIPLEEHLRIIDDVRKSVKVEAAKALLESQDRMKREHKSAMAEREKSFKEREEVVRREMVQLKGAMQDLMILARKKRNMEHPVSTPMQERMMEPKSPPSS
eukprot:g2821.t1